MITDSFKLTNLRCVRSNPFLLVSKMDGDEDEFSRAMALNPLFPVGMETQRDTIVKDIAKMFGCNQANVLLNVNYTNDEKIFELDRSLYKMLYCVMKEAMAHKVKANMEETKASRAENRAKTTKVHAHLTRVTSPCFLPSQTRARACYRR